MAATAEALGRELADTLSAIKRPPPNRTFRIAYATVLSVDHPYATVQHEDGSTATYLHGKVRPIVGRTWRIRWVLGIALLDDWAASVDLA